MDIDEETSEEYRAPRTGHDVHEPTTYELAEMEAKEQERAMRYYFDAKHNMI
jgi:hypothetical protein